MFVPGNNSRRNADVLICAQFRRYISYGTVRRRLHQGIALYSDGERIENFPKQHSKNLTAKHQATNGNFKPMVRVFKNMRNSMIEKNLLADGVAPSYFIEGMLANVPNDKFADDYGETCGLRASTGSSQRTSPSSRPGSGLDWLVTGHHPGVLAVGQFSHVHGGTEEVLGELTVELRCSRR